MKTTILISLKLKIICREEKSEKEKKRTKKT